MNTRVFTILATIVSLIGVVQLFLALSWGDSALFISGCLSLLHGWAWSLVNEMSEQLDRLEKKS